MNFPKKWGKYSANSHFLGHSENYWSFFHKFVSIKQKDDNKAQIELDGQPCTISSCQMGHSFLYDNNNTRRFLYFIHTPADIVAEYLVERYCSDSWLEDEIQRRMVIFKEFQTQERMKFKLRTKYYDNIELLKNIIMSERKDYEDVEDFYGWELS